MAQVSPLMNAQQQQVVPEQPVVPEQAGSPIPAPQQAQQEGPQVATPVPQAPPLQAPAFDPATGTVEGRVAGIVGKDSPLQQLAKTKALQQSQQRGLLNTSMAVGAAQKANMEAALPIAQQDAAFYQQQELQNQKANIDKQLLTASADEQLRLILEKGKIDTAMQELRGSQEVSLTDQRGEIQKQLLSAEGAQKADLLAQQSQIDFKLTAQKGEIEKSIVAQQGEIQKQLLSAEGAQKADLLAQQGQLDLTLAIERGKIASDLQDQLFDINTQLETTRATLDLKNQSTLLDMKADIETELQGLVGSQALEQQGLKGEQAEALTRLEKEYDTMINTQRAAALTYTETSRAISEILSNPDIPTEAKGGLISQQMTLLNSSLAVMGGIVDTDLTGLLNFGTPPPTAAPTNIAMEKPVDKPVLPTVSTGTNYAYDPNNPRAFAGNFY